MPSIFEYIDARLIETPQPQGRTCRTGVGDNDVEGAFFCRVRRDNLDETRLSKGKAILEHEHENEIKTKNKLE